MIGKLARLPFTIAKKVARKIQEDEARGRATVPTRDGPKAVLKDHIPATELADLPPEQVQISVAEAQAAQAAWVDVRDPADWRGEHIAGAMSMPLLDVMIRLAELPPEGTLVTVCADGSDALTAALFLRARGFEEVVALAGGMEAWRAAGGATESS